MDPKMMEVKHIFTDQGSLQSYLLLEMFPCYTLNLNCSLPIFF